MIEPVTYTVWSEHLDGSHEGVECVAYSAFGAVLFAVAMFADDSDAGAEQGYVLPFPGETWFARSPSGEVTAFRQRDELNTIFERVSPRADYPDLPCIVCGAERGKCFHTRSWAAP